MSTLTTRPRSARSLLILLAAISAAANAFAHGIPAPLEQWGNFGATTAACQRAIGRVAARCAASAVHHRNLCLGADMDGVGCDPVAMADAAIAERHRGADIIQRYCSSTDLQNLNYIDLSDALIDIALVCRETDRAATSGIWGPVMAGGAVGAAGPDEARCIRSTARITARALRFAVRVQQRALNRIAAANLTDEEKAATLSRARSLVERVRTRAKQRLLAACPSRDFEALYGRDADSILDGITRRAECVNGFVYVVDGAAQCPAPVCGNGIEETGEECDDGNAFEGDACLSDCTKAECDSFANTYDLIQKAIFENRGCTAELCHSSVDSAGGLDLTAGNSYASLVDVPAATAPGYKRVDPGNRANSLLWVNVAARVVPEVTAPVRAMPLGPNPLTAAEVEALRLWIETGGATRTETVPGTAELLDACLPEPKPIEIAPLAPPPPGEGIQLHMPVWRLPGMSESEVCFTSYFDLSDRIPAQFRTADGTKFRYKRVEIRQDPLSHHLIIDFFRGAVAPDAPVWGPYTCKGGEREGESCHPTERGVCGDGDCATDPDPTAIACIGFGPQQGLSTLTSGGFAFAQETTTVFDFPADVYGEVPIRGNVLWNSHAFNLTRTEGKLEAWVNIYFPEPLEQVFAAQQIFNTQKIFWDVPFVNFVSPRAIPSFEELEVCHIHTFGRPPEQFADSPLSANETARLFELSGHMHEHGKRFQIYRGMFTCDGGSAANQACSPNQPEMCPGSTCRDVGGRDPGDALLYTNLLYNDPIVLRLDPPIVLSGAAPVENRTLTYCAHYENGVAPNIQQVKRRSASAPPGSILGFPIGGPCAVSRTRCIGGAKHNSLCQGDDAACDSAPGLGDGDCDACPLTGGFRTQDEMFILFGNYWVTN
jgi:cysteine-rich repeat protein